MLLWCRTCFEIINDDRFSNVNSVLPNYEPEKIINDSLGECLPGLDLQIVNNAVMCEVCVELLAKLQAFRNGCFETEDKIRMYIIKHGPECVDLSLDIVPDVEIESDSEEVLDRKNLFKSEDDLIDIEDNRIEDLPGEPPQSLLGDPLENSIKVQPDDSPQSLPCRIATNSLENSEDLLQSTHENTPGDPLEKRLDESSEEDSSDDTPSVGEDVSGGSDCTYRPTSESDDSYEAPPLKRKKIQTRSSIGNSTRLSILSNSSHTSSTKTSDTGSSSKASSRITDTLARSSNFTKNTTSNSLYKQANNRSILLDMLLSASLEDKSSPIELPGLIITPDPKPKQSSERKDNLPSVSIELVSEDDHLTTQPIPTQRPFRKLQPKKNSQLSIALSEECCLVCKQRFGELPLLYMHMNGQHKTELGIFMESIGSKRPTVTDGSKGLYECPLCLKQFGLISVWKMHMYSHTEMLNLFATIRKDKIRELSCHYKGKTFHCLLCNDSFPDATAIYDHMNKDHKNLHLAQPTLLVQQPELVPSISSSNLQICTICKALLYNPSPQDVEAHLRIHTLQVIPSSTPAQVTQNSTVSVDIDVAGDTSKSAPEPPVLEDARTIEKNKSDKSQEESCKQVSKPSPACRPVSPIILDDDSDEGELSSSSSSSSRKYSTCPHCGNRVENCRLDEHIYKHEIDADRLISGKSFNPNYMFCSFCARYIKTLVIEAHIKKHADKVDMPSKRSDLWLSKQNLWFCSFCCKYINCKENWMIRKHICSHVSRKIPVHQTTTAKKPQAAKEPGASEVCEVPTEPMVIDLADSEPEAEPEKPNTPKPDKPPETTQSRAEADELELVEVVEDRDFLLCEVCSDLVPYHNVDEHRRMHSRGEQVSEGDKCEVPQTFDDVYQIAIREAANADDSIFLKRYNLEHGALDLSHTTAQEALDLTNTSRTHSPLSSTPSIPPESSSNPPRISGDGTSDVPSTLEPSVLTDLPSIPIECSSQFLSRSTVSELLADRCSSESTTQAENSNDLLALKEIADSNNCEATPETAHTPNTSSTPPCPTSEILSNDSAIAMEDSDELTDLTSKEKHSKVQVTTFSYDIELHSVKPVQAEQDHDNFDSLFSLSNDPSLSMAPPDSLDNEGGVLHLFMRKPEQRMAANFDLSHMFDQQMRGEQLREASEQEETREKSRSEEEVSEDKNDNKEMSNNEIEGGMNENNEKGEEVSEKGKNEALIDESNKVKDKIEGELKGNRGKEEEVSGKNNNEEMTSNNDKDQTEQDMNEDIRKKEELSEKDKNGELTDGSNKVKDKAEEDVNENIEKEVEVSGKNQNGELNEIDKNEELTSTHEKDQIEQKMNENIGKEEEKNRLKQHEQINEKKREAKVSVYGTRSRTRKESGDTYTTRRWQRNVTSMRKRKR